MTRNALTRAASQVDWRGLAWALGLGIGGGAVALWLTLPLPWMIGAMLTVTAAVLMGAPAKLPGPTRNVMVTVLGLMVGSGFTPAVIGRMGEWAVTLAALAIWSALAGSLGYLYFRRVAKLDPVTSYFSGMPGGFAEMIAIGRAMGGDDRVISLAHTVRVLLVVFSIPVWYRLEAGVSSTPRVIQLWNIGAFDLAVLALCALVGALGARRLRLPGADILGPMALSAIVHLTGIIDSSPPYLITAAAQVVIGAGVGTRFAGVRLAVMGRALGHALVTGVLMIAYAVAAALILRPITGFALPELVLAFAPGGLAEMSLVAFALGVDAAYVACHHVFRITLVITTAPFFFKRTVGRAETTESS